MTTQQVHTVKGTLRTIRTVAGMSASHRDGEYRVSYPAHEVPSTKAREDSAYYTPDADDAINTAMDMRRRAQERAA